MPLTVSLDGADPCPFDVSGEEDAASLLRRAMKHFGLAEGKAWLVNLLCDGKPVPLDMPLSDLGCDGSELRLELRSGTAEPYGWKFCEHTYPAFENTTRETLVPLDSKDAFVVHYLASGSGFAEFPDAVVHSSLAWQGVSAMVHMRHPTEHGAYFTATQDGRMLAIFEGCFRDVDHGASNVHCPHMWWTRSPDGETMLPPNGGHVVLELVKGDTLPLRCLNSSYRARGSFEEFEVLREARLVLETSGGKQQTIMLEPGDRIEAGYHSQCSAKYCAGSEKAPVADIVFEGFSKIAIPSQGLSLRTDAEKAVLHVK